MKQFFLIQTVDGKKFYINSIQVALFSQTMAAVTLGENPRAHTNFDTDNPSSYKLKEGEKLMECVKLICDTHDFPLYVLGTVEEFITLNS
jgi:hypothetical protein